MSENKTDNKRVPSLSTYYLLGRSGLRVSPLCLGTMTFGNERIGDSDTVSRQVFDRYLEAGGNFIDTADIYSDSRSETLLGEFMRDTGNRDHLVLATKFNFNLAPEDPNFGGNGRKHMRQAVEDSLERLQTDYIDLYWMHAWDVITPVEEVLQTLADLVREGKIRYYGFSDTPAWYVGKLHGLAEARGLPAPVALQLEYSLVRRDIEHEFVPAAQNLGLGICPWSPLAGGLLTGKYTREKMEEGRVKMQQQEGGKEGIPERRLAIIDTLLETADGLGRHPAQVALNWVTRRPGVISPIFGARTLEQLENNIQSLEFEIPAERLDALEKASAQDIPTPYNFFSGNLLGMGRGQYQTLAEPPWFRQKPGRES